MSNSYQPVVVSVCTIVLIGAHHIGCKHVITARNTHVGGGALLFKKESASELYHVIEIITNRSWDEVVCACVREEK